MLFVQFHAEFCGKHVKWNICVITDCTIRSYTMLLTSPTWMPTGNKSSFCSIITLPAIYLKNISNSVGQQVCLGGMGMLSRLNYFEMHVLIFIMPFVLISQKRCSKLGTSLTFATISQTNRLAFLLPYSLSLSPRGFLNTTSQSTTIFSSKKSLTSDGSHRSLFLLEWRLLFWAR